MNSLEIQASILDAIQEAVLCVDRECRINYWNNAAEELYGWKKEEVMGRYAPGVIGSEIIENDRKKMLCDAFTGLRVEKEAVHHKRNGEKLYISLVIISLKNEEGEICGYGIICRDITEHKKTKQTLKEVQAISNQRLDEIEDLYRNAPVGLCVLDSELRWVRINEHLAQINGYPVSEHIGKRVRDLLPELAETAEPLMYKVIETGEPLLNLEIRDKDRLGNERFWLANWLPLRNQENKTVGINIVAENVTDRINSQKKLENTLQNLERSNRDLEQFAYVASHDLKEPLRMVTTYSQMLSKCLNDKMDDKSRQYMDFVIDGSKRMYLLIHDLLSYSRVTSRGDEFFLIDLNDVVSNVLADLNLTLKSKNAKVTYDKLPAVKADRIQIGQLFQNLISNAIKFNKSNNPEVHISSVKNKDEWLLSINDNGIGIEQDYYDKIFIIFQRLHNRNDYQGTGIGLSICKRIAERHGGRIWVESIPGKGSTFYFTIPA